MNSQERYLQDYVLSVAFYSCLCLMAYLFVVRFAKTNILAYGLSGYFWTLALTAMELCRHARFGLVFPQLAILVVALAAPFVYTAWLYLAPRKELEVVPPDSVAS